MYSEEWILYLQQIYAWGNITFAWYYNKLYIYILNYFCIFANYSYIIKTGQQIYNNKDLTDTFKVIYP